MLTTALFASLEADLTSQLLNNKLMEQYKRRIESDYLKVSHSEQALKLETSNSQNAVYMINIKKIQKSAVLSVKKCVKGLW
jgi:hypothetical protein